MAIVTGDRYLDYLVKFVDKQAGPLLEGTLVLKLNPVGLHYVQSRLEALQELERLLAAAPIDYLRAYVSDLGDHRALEQLRRILRLLTSLKVVSVFPPPARDPTPLSLLPFGRLKYLELRGCDLSTSAARGLLELRHTLEKFICHNSTDALRHVFASRIVDIRKSPVWNRLSFVSCACNALVLMDESLQLLPAVETLDLSRNKFAKVDNLRKCTKLRFLDLGFNHLRTITSFSEVSCSIAKLVLRNNALTSLRGIENLKLLEGLDLSYNIISNFSELEILTSLPSLQSLWLEGNPICCARWYRSQVFSFFTYPQRLKLDDKLISKRETWKRQIILARRQKRPAGFGFYSPATHDAEGEGNFNMKKKKFSRLASIEDDEQRRYTCSDSVDHDAGSCDSEIRSREESIISDGETEIVGLVNRIESMKKERSFLWLRDLKEWMDQNSENVGENRNFTGQNSFPGKEISIKNVKRQKNFGNSSRYVTESVQASGDENSTNILESENSFADSSIDFHAHQYFDLNQEMVLDLPVGVNDTFLPDRFAVQGNDNMDVKVNTPLTAIDEIMESYSSSACPSSPPHYQEDILHRRHNLEEEFIQLSADSYSVASSDSDTSSSEDNFYQYGTSLYEVDGLQHKKSLSTMERSMNDNMHILLSNDNYYDKTDKELGIVRQNGRTLLDTSIDHGFSIVGVGRLKPDNAQQSFTDNILFSASNSGIDHVMSQQADSLEKKRFRTKPKRRIISLSEENCMASNAEVSYQELNNTPEVCKAKMEDEPQNQIPRMISPPLSENDIFIKNYFHSKVADATVSETCMQYIRCDSILEQESGYQEREVALLLSSENKLYILLIDVTSDGSGTISKVIGYHRLEDIKEIVVGIGLQILSVNLERVAPYLFITKSIDKSRRLLNLLQVVDSCASNRCSFKSLEQVQLKLFERHICGALKMSIFLYTMLLFRQSNCEDDPWLLRSLFVIEGYVVVCIEDLVRFSSLSLDDRSSSTYFSLDSCCSISNITELIIEPWESWSVTLTLDRVTSKNLGCFADPKKEKNKAKLKNEKMAMGSLTWKLKWFSEETLFKFVGLLKAMYAGTTLSPLPVRCIS